MKKWITLVFVLTCTLSLVACNMNKGADGINRINIVYAGTEEIYGIGYAYYVDGELVCSGGVCNADGSTIKTGDDFVLEKEQFLEKGKKVELELSVNDKSEKEYVCPSKITLDIAWEIKITGDYRNGFDVS